MIPATSLLSSMNRIPLSGVVRRIGTSACPRPRHYRSLSVSTCRASICRNTPRTSRRLDCTPIRSNSTASATSTPATQPWKRFKAEPINADIYAFLEPQTSTWQYLLVDPLSLETAIIDPVLDYNPASGALSTTAADGLLSFVAEKNLKVVRILETHAHADHLTASQYLKKMLPGDVPVGIGARIKQVQDHFAPVYGFGFEEFLKTFDVFFQDEEEFRLGDVSCRVIHLPGHTPDHVGYMIGNAVFTGDSIFMPDIGSARADFPGGNAKDLYASMNRLLSLPKDYQLFVGHDYPVNRQHECMCTVGVHQENNKHAGITRDRFIEFREARDNVLGAPRLLHPSLQVNIRAGKLPTPSNDRVWLKTPARLVNPNIPVAQ